MAPLVQQLFHTLGLGTEYSDESPYVKFPGGEIQVRIINHLQQHQTPLRLVGAYAQNLPKDITTGKTYDTHDYRVEREGNKWFITGQVADDGGLAFPFKIGPGKEEGPLILDVPHAQKKSQELIVAHERGKIDKVVGAWRDYNDKPVKEIQVGNFVTWKKDLFAGGPSNDAIFLVVEIGKKAQKKIKGLERRVYEKSCFIEHFDCILFGPDGNGDMMFYPANSKRLKLIDHTVLATSFMKNSKLHILKPL